MHVKTLADLHYDTGEKVSWEKTALSLQCLMKPLCCYLDIGCLPLSADSEE